MEKQEIIKALIKFQSEVPDIELNSTVKVKTKSGGSYSFKYADLPYIVETIQPTLTACKLAVYYQISDLEISIIVAHESGEFIMSSLPLQFGNNPQENGSLITYYKRYLLTSTLNLVAEQDDDANVSLNNKFEKTEKNNSDVKKSNEEKPWLNKYSDKSKTDITENYQKVLHAMINGYTIEQVRGKYKVSKETFDLLTDDIEEAIESEVIKKEQITK